MAATKTTATAKKSEFSLIGSNDDMESGMAVAGIGPFWLVVGGCEPQKMQANDNLLKCNRSENDFFPSNQSAFRMIGDFAGDDKSGPNRVRRNRDQGHPV